MSRKQKVMGVKSALRLSAITLAGLLAVGCATVEPTPLATQDMKKQVQVDGEAIRKDVEPITGPLTLEEAMARALKYNLEHRAKMMEQALALGQLDVGKFDMLPKIMAQAGYSSRSIPRFTASQSYSDWVTNGTYTPSQAASQGYSTSSEADHYTAELGLTWSLLDVGLGYYGAKQNEARFQIASEKRRKAMHLLMQDVRNAYWRAASAQLLKAEVKKTIALAEEAMVDSKKLAAERVKNPLEPLRYQRQLLENLRLLENINQELSSAQVELASLINAPLGQAIVIADADIKNIDGHIEDVPHERLEEVAMMGNPDLREQHYNTRIAQEETRRTLARLFPNLVFNYGAKYDTDNYIMNRHWNEAGLQLSFNLMNLFTGNTQMKLAEAGVKLADQRRIAMQMTVLTQMHLARLAVINSRSQFERADAVFKTDQKISEVMRARQSVQQQSKLDLVSTQASEILSLLRRYQALAQVQVAENRLIATLGLDMDIGSLSEVSLKDLTEKIRQNKAPWKQLIEGATKADQLVKVPTVVSKW